MVCCFFCRWIFFKFLANCRACSQLLESPVSWNIIPMQIDTRRRDCGVTRDSIGNCSKFEPWMEPKQARYGRRVSRANYSGILECPCNSRYGGDPIFYPDAKTKLISHQFSAIASGVCDASKRVASAGDCFEGAASIGIHARQMRNLTISDESQVGGCFVTMQDDGTAVVTYNTAGTRPCTPAKVYAGAATSAVGVTFNLTIDTVADVATISIAGPADVWFGVGVGATAMADAPYTFIVNSSGVHERQIGTCGSEAEHCAGDALSRSTTLLSNSVNDAAIRTVVFTRPLRGATPKHYTFDPSKDATLNFISAVGSSQQFAYHKAHHAAVVTLLSSPASSHTCLCDLNLEGQLCENGGVKCFKFKRNCKKPWNGDEMSDGGDLLAQRNPTCNSRQYSGGLGCCGHKRVLLDADQDPGPSLLRYHMKVRFWFQEYTPPQFHKDVFTKRHGQVVGPDARPPLTTTVQHALALCANTSTCRAITFADAPTLTPTLTSAVSPTLVSTIASVPRTSALPTYRVRPLLIHFKQSATTEPISQPVLTHATTGPTPTYTSYVAAHSSAPSHFNLPRYYYQTEANAGEYDVPPAFRRHNDPPIPGYPETPVSTKGDMHLTPGSSCTGNCPDGADCECVHTITYHWKVDSLSVIYAGGHCHAPSCVSIELWKNDTGTPELLCLQTTKYGKGDTHHDKFDEAGYLVLPPCLFGDEAEGLYPPVYLPPNTPLISVKRNRNTYSGHFGEMASWQMRGVPFDPDAPLVKAA
uniref:Uncharacterized protein n=1 Tax=Chrysotila carterae TaxID=13221 RepID=A0A7S4F885_CHRCT